MKSSTRPGQKQAAKDVLKKGRRADCAGRPLSTIDAPTSRGSKHACPARFTNHFPSKEDNCCWRSMTGGRRHDRGSSASGSKGKRNPLGPAGNVAAVGASERAARLLAILCRSISPNLPDSARRLNEQTFKAQRPFLMRKSSRSFADLDITPGTEIGFLRLQLLGAR